MAIINHGNTPMIGNSHHVIRWNATTAQNAGARVRLQDSSATTVQSNSAPAQLATNAVLRSASNGPITGRCDLAGNHIASGRACASQSPLSLAIPANVYTTPTWARTIHTASFGTSAGPRRRASSDHLADIGRNANNAPASVMNQ